MRPAHRIMSSPPLITPGPVSFGSDFMKPYSEIRP